MSFPEWLNLNAVWFVLVGVLFTGYALLDGFDLGVGVLQVINVNLAPTDDGNVELVHEISDVADLRS